MMSFVTKRDHYHHHDRFLSDETEFPFSNDVAKYEKINKIGQGTYGEVFKARVKPTREIVALKKILLEDDCSEFPITVLREIRILQELKHENVVSLLEVCRTKITIANKLKSTFYLVFEFCDHDLAGLLANADIKFTLGQIKMVMQQLLNGLQFIHSNNFIHRDMKTANILITRAGSLKLADFGLSRPISPDSSRSHCYTNRVVTLWYRPPELLLGEKNYGPSVDMWGVGCIMAEMWTRTPILQGESEQEQLSLISRLCGSISPAVWPEVATLAHYRSIRLPRGEKRKTMDRLWPLVKDPFACRLLDLFLTLDPSQRISAYAAMDHDFFWTNPPASSLSSVLAQYGHSMFEYLTRNNGPGRAPLSSRPQQRQKTSEDGGSYQDRIF